MRKYPPDPFAALDLLRRCAMTSDVGSVAEYEEALRTLRTVLEKERIVRRAFREMATGVKSRRPMPPAFIGDSSAPTIAVNAILDCTMIAKVWGKVSIRDPIVDRSEEAASRKARVRSKRSTTGGARRERGPRRPKAR